MEDMARLALVEQKLGNADEFRRTLYELLRHINNILENPHDYDLRTINSDLLKTLLKQDVFAEYLKTIGYTSVGDTYCYPKEQTLNNLRVAQAAIERKIYFCCGLLNKSEMKSKSNVLISQVKKPTLLPVYVANSANSLLVRIQNIFNDVLKYEDEDLQEEARRHIPLTTLQLMAIDRMREHQRKLKAGEIEGQDLNFDMALLSELLGWFKYKFFSWVNKPECEACGGPTKLTRTASMTNEKETYRVELYECTQCPDGRARFPRYNDARTLLVTRRGRCGEWANCFALLCRALGYDTRYVYDTTDHVWCEVFDYDTNSWIHVDPCEGKMNAPLMYCHGWNKKLSYVVAASRDDLQDVTWRYTVSHKEVLSRRTEVPESELVQAILSLRAARQARVSEPRRRYLARRTLTELASLMLERKPSDYESQGRQSGSGAWRAARGEARAEGHAFLLPRVGRYCLRYYTGLDQYRLGYTGDDPAKNNEEVIDTWAAGVFECDKVFRKLETDWRKAYLAREEDESCGKVSWKLSAGENMSVVWLSVRLCSALYETGRIDWTVQFDKEDPQPVNFGDKEVIFERGFSSAVLSASLSGGTGDTAWQHAQLFRQDVDAKACAFEILAQVHSIA